VDFENYAEFALDWLAEQGNGNYDARFDISIPADGIIDERDLKIFTDNWLAGK